MTINHQGVLSGIHVKFPSFKFWIRRHDPCVYCGKTPDSGRHTMDHLVPESRGGKDVAENLAPSCYGCNHMKSSTGLLMFLLERRHSEFSRFVRGCLCRTCQVRRDREYNRQNRVTRRLRFDAQLWTGD